MTSKERVKRTIHFMGVDRIPHFLPDGGENDIVWMWPDLSSLEGRWNSLGGDLWEKKDAWGTTWRRIGTESMGEAHELALSDWSKFDSYEFPKLNRPEFFTGALRAAERRPDRYFLGVMPYNSLFEGAHVLRGLADLLPDFYAEPEKVGRLLDGLLEGQIESIDLLAGLGCDGVMGYDDWGIQDRPLIGMNIWDEFYRPRYKKAWDHAHSKGLDVWLHSCGYILPILKEMAAIGLDVIQMDQQENIGLENLDREVGGKVAFWCPVDIQKTMVEGGPAAIEAYVKKMIYHLGRFGGGLISMSYGSPGAVGHTKENLGAMCAAFRKYGIYGLSQD